MNKKNKISYIFHNHELNEKDIAQELIKKILVKAAPSSSCWWSKMKSRTDVYKDNLDRIIAKQSNFIKTGIDYTSEDSDSTAKTCAGILGLFGQTFLVKSPTQIVITLNKNGNFVFDIADQSIVTIKEHPKSQFSQENDKMFDNKVCIKFSLGLSLKTTGFSYMLSDPTYHSNSGCYVPMGLISEKYANNQQLNIITLVDIPKDEKTIIINEGDTIAYLIPFKRCILSFAKTNFIYKRFKKDFVIKKWFK